MKKQCPYCYKPLYKPLSELDVEVCGNCKVLHTRNGLEVSDNGEWVPIPEGVLLVMLEKSA
jgi:hypothetical protein